MLRVAAHLLPAELGSRNLRQRVERQADVEIAGRRSEQGAELPLGRVERRVRHVVDEPDVDAIRIGSRRQSGLAAPALRPLERRDAEGDWRSVIIRPLLAEPIPSRIERLIEVADDVVDVLDADAEPDHFRRHAGLPLFVRRTSVDAWWTPGWQASDLASPRLTSRLISVSAS